MAKKKLSATGQLLHTPISIPLFGAMALLATGIVSLNISVFLQQPKETSVVPSAITQNTLQDVLGTSISIGDSTPPKTSNTNDPVATYWQNVAASKPNYRDAYITLAVNAFNKRDCESTRFYINKVFEIDPNNQTLQELLPKLKSCLSTPQQQ